jgi:competence protein ComEC
VWASAAASGAALGPWWAGVRALGAVRAWSQSRLAGALDPATAPLATALLLGRREGVDPDVNDAFARTGTTHLLAISGLHLQVLAWALGGSLRLLGLARRPAHLAVAAGTLAYSLLVGLMPSVVRSAAMTGSYCLAGVVDRRTRSANTLALAALATLALNPAHLFDVGCQLSFLAIAAITWAVGPVLARVFPEPDPLTALERHFAPWWRRRVRRIWTWTVEGMTVSTVVWLAAVPLVLLRFHLLSPIGVLLNVPLIPITSLALLAAGVSLGLSAVWAPLGTPAAWVCSASLTWTDAIVRWGAAQRWGHTFAPAPPWGWVLGFYVALGLAVAAALGLWPGRKALVGLTAALVPLGFLLTFRTWAGLPEADVLAVGHGLAVVVDIGHGHALLYDCGRMRDPSVGRRIVAPALWARGVRTIDSVVLSHADPCHHF